MKKWKLEFICCGYSDGTMIFDSWEEAHTCREAYAASARDAGHHRAAILKAVADE